MTVKLNKDEDFYIFLIQETFIGKVSIGTASFLTLLIVMVWKEGVHLLLFNYYQNTALRVKFKTLNKPVTKA